MPVQQGPFYYSGRLGNTVGFVREGKYFYRDSPTQIEINSATKLENADLIRAAKAGKFIRNAIMPCITIPCDNQYRNRLNKILLNILHSGKQERRFAGFQHLDLSGLTGFQFNELSQINSIVTFEGMDLDKYNNLSIPFSTLKSIQDKIKTSHIEVEIISMTISLVEKNRSFALRSRHLVDLSLPSSKIVAKLLSFRAGPEDSITIMQVRAFSKTNKGIQPSKNIKKMAAGIIRVVPCL